MKIKNKSITLVELLISMVIMSIVILGIYSVIAFSTNQIVSSSRKSKVQSDLAFALEHMSKYAQQATGNFSNPAFTYLGTSLRVRIDFNNTPFDINDDPWLRYQLVGNTLRVSCSGGIGCPAIFPIDLSKNIVGGFMSDTLMPQNPGSGFYVKISSGGNAVDIGLVGRYTPNRPVAPANPQIEMKTKLVASSISVN